MTPASFDAITRRAVARMCARANGDWAYIARIHEKARDLRAHRAAQSFLDSLRRPVDTEAIVTAIELRRAS